MMKKQMIYDLLYLKELEKCGITTPEEFNNIIKKIVYGSRNKKRKEND